MTSIAVGSVFGGIAFIGLLIFGICCCKEKLSGCGKCSLGERLRLCAICSCFKFQRLKRNLNNVSNGEMSTE